MYEKQDWSDVYGETPFNADRMKHIEDGIYENSLDNVYSTDEVFTGKYSEDGKKIYRKIIKNVTINQGTAIKVSVANVDIETLITLKGMLYSAGLKQWFTIPSYYSSTIFVSANLYYPEKNILVDCIGIEGIARFTIEYTKTTD